MRAAALGLVVVAAGCPPPVPKATAPTAASTAQIVAIPLATELPPTSAGIGAPGTIVEALYDVCLDEAGRVARVSPPGGAADDALGAALRRWSWYVVAGAPRPCWRQSVLLGVPAASRIVRQAGGEVRAQALTRPTTPPSRALMTLHAGEIVDAQYKVCVGDEGQVQSVRAVRGIAGGDDWGSAVVRATAWEVVVGTLAQAPYCFAASVRLESKVPRGEAPRLPAPSARPKEPGVSIVVTR